MSYLANQTRVSSLLIGGTDYTSSLVQWVVSDQSAYKNGCLQTTGTLVLGSYAGGPPVEDYDRNIFRRGVVVTLDLAEPGGAPYRHPRGYLHVISSSYDVENEQLIVELGCRLVLIALTEEIDDLVAITPVALDIAQTTYQNCSAAFSSLGQYVYQDNQGALQVGTFFDGDGYGGVASGDWVSILGVTATSAQPLAGTGAVPDRINLSYQVPSDGLNEDSQGRVDTVETDSYYFARYPAVVFIRKNSDASPNNPNGTISNIDDVYTGPVLSSGSGGSSCGNSPDQPADNGDDGTTNDSCNQGYSVEQEPLFLPAFRREESVTEYNAPGAQVSRSYRSIRGPAIEANAQYYADKFAYCRATWATACQPNGSCPYEGMEEILLSYDETINYYGDANELVRTIVDSYVPVLSAAQPSDWRSGINGGIPQDFNQNLSTTDMFRTSRRDTTYYQEGSINVQEDVSYASMASRNVGIGGDLDALNGIETVQIRRSATTATVEIAPDRVNNSTTATDEKSIEIVLFTGRFKTPPAEAGPYIIDEQIPVPLLFESESEVNSAVDAYSNYLERFVKGDAFGLQLGEAMRSDVVASWRPGMPFRYHDPQKARTLAFRMDATSWGVDQNESAFVTNGIWIGESDGNVTIPDNLVGNSLPDMGSGVIPPITPIPPSVDDETSVDSGSFSWVVDVFFSFSAGMTAFGNDGVVPILPSDLNYNVNFTMTCFVSGLVASPGDILATESNGSIPLDLAGSLVTADAVLVTPDLFA
jgi:hypothetical protein